MFSLILAESRCCFFYFLQDLFEVRQISPDTIQCVLTLKTLQDNFNFDGTNN